MIRSRHVHSVPLRRTVVVLGLPLAIVTTVCGRLARELRSACRLAWLDVRQEVDSAKRLWCREQD
jgi:hypothetical protein